MKSEKIIVGVLIGAAAGAIIGVLFAPYKGAKTRKKIVDSTTDLKESLKDKVSDFVDSITEQFQHTKNKVIEGSKDKYASSTDHAKHSLS